MTIEKRQLKDYQVLCVWVCTCVCENVCMCMSVCVQLLYPLLIHFNKTGCSGVRLRSSGESQIPWRVVVSRPKRPVSIGVWSGLSRWRPLERRWSRRYHCWRLLSRSNARRPVATCQIPWQVVLDSRRTERNIFSSRDHFQSGQIQIKIHSEIAKKYTTGARRFVRSYFIFTQLFT